jgi:hypothetical protein
LHNNKYFLNWWTISCSRQKTVPETERSQHTD